MKIQSLLAAISTITCLVLGIANSGSQNIKMDSLDDSLLACVWHPYCDIPDISSPILKPKDNKTETQDTKDEKLA